MMRGNRSVYSWSLQNCFSGALLLALCIFGDVGWIIGIALWVFAIFYCAFTWLVLNSDMKWWTNDMNSLREFEKYARATREYAENELKEKKL